MKRHIIASLLLAGSGMAQAADTFIAVSPATFSRSFNTWAAFLGEGMRLPAWAATNGVKRAVVAKGITVHAQGSVGGQGMAEVKVVCQNDAKCAEAMVVAAHAVDPEVSVNSLHNYMQGRTTGRLDDESAITQNGITYYMDLNRKARRMELWILPEEDSGEGDGSFGRVR
ncbi:hypothetical protein [Brachymonas chironomi]|uniref:hypothetical protein n=1 Tax=Brachymonas chironomi TaxID=491919 RepID=UPI00036DF8F3|nr:hypothetical protein [Brachymonas chironomi]